MSPPILQPVRPAFRALAVTLCPEAATLDEAGWIEAEAIVERALAERPSAVARQLVLFVRLVGRWLPLLRFGRPFRRLDDERRASLLRGLERSRVLLLRRGLWGLRTLVFMGVYGQDEVRERIGSRASPAGWSALRQASEDPEGSA